MLVNQWEDDNIEIDLQDVGIFGFPKMRGICGRTGELIFSRRTLLRGIG
jgi:hypothetical protein